MNDFNALRVALCIDSGIIIFIFDERENLRIFPFIFFTRKGRGEKRQLPRRFLRKRGGGKIFADFQRAELPQSKPDGFDSSLREGAFGMAVRFLAQPQSFRVCPLPRGELSRSD